MGPNTYVAVSRVFNKTATRRAIIQASVAAGLILGLPGDRSLAAQDTDPRVTSFITMATALVGGGRIDPKRAEQFIALNDADPSNAKSLDALLAEDPDTVLADPTAYPLVVPIVTFFYVGSYNDEPVADRQSFWYGLTAWQAVVYTSSTSICKRFGDWAEPPTVT